MRSYAPGEHNGLVCPKCKGGSSGSEHSFNINIKEDGLSAAWLCHRRTCNFQGGAGLDSPAPKGARGFLVSPPV